MNKRSIIINSLSPGGDKLQKTLTDVNPAATPTQITTFTRALNALTNNSYASTQSIDRDVVMSTTPDPKAPTCFLMRLDAEEYVQAVVDGTQAQIRDNLSYQQSFFMSKILNGDKAGIWTNSDATPVISKLPEHVAMTLTDQTDYVRNLFAQMLEYYDNGQPAIPTTAEQIVSQCNVNYAGVSDNEMATIVGIYKDMLITAKKFWKISITYSTECFEHLQGDYIITLPATVKHSAASFKFTVVPNEP